MNLPSGGMNESSPGFSFHRANRTHGWNTGNCIVLEIPEDFAELVPPGAVSTSMRSGTPEIFEVNAIDPFARADSNRPDGANMTRKDSRISTYSSFDVCRTFGLRHGIAGPAAAVEFAFSVAARLFEPTAGAELRTSVSSHSHSMLQSSPWYSYCFE